MIRRTKWLHVQWLAGVFGWLAAAFSCPQAALAETFARQGLSVGGVARSYLLYEPQHEGNGERPLVILLHGGGGSARQIAGRPTNSGRAKPASSTSTPAAALTRLPKRIVWAAERVTPVVEALVEAGVPVVAPTAGGLARDVLAGRLARGFDRRLVDVEHELTLVAAVPGTGADLALVDALAQLLDRAVRRPSEVALVELTGAVEGAPFAAGGRDHALVTLDERRWVIERETAGKSPLALLWRPALLLNTRTPLVAAARRRAEEDATTAASMLTRALLLHHRTLDATVSQELLEATLARLGARW